MAKTMHDDRHRYAAMLLLAASMAIVAGITLFGIPAAQRPDEPALAASTASVSAHAPAGERFVYPTNLVGVPVFSADGEELGRVVKASVAANGEVRHIYVEVPEFLGIGSRVVAVPSGLYEWTPERVELAISADAARLLADAR